METRELLIRTFERTPVALANALKDVRPEELKWRPGPQANHIAFILWHLTRGEDRFIQTRVLQKPQVWEAGNWAQRLAIPAGPSDTGNSYTSAQVAAFPIPRLEDMMAYNQAVRVSTMEFIRSVKPEGLDRVVDSPRGPMSVAELLTLSLAEINQHIGQIDYIRGLAQSLRK